MSDQIQILILGYIVRGPLAGLAWHHLQYVMGLAQLGHQVYFLEDSDDYPSCYDPARGITDTDATYGLEFIQKAFTQLELGECWAYYDAHTDTWFGPVGHRIGEICATAELLLNVSGVNPLRSWFLEIPKRVFIDTDPVFTQIRHLTIPSAYQLAQQHTDFFSFGENISEKNSKIPKDGFSWQPTRQPIVLDAWRVIPPQKAGNFTTVMQWDSYTTREFQGIHYGMKSASFQSYLDLPSKVNDGTFELALGSPSAPRDLLQRKGWKIRDPLQVTRTLWTYQDYIQQSQAEFGVAKQGYVISNSGWFSERSACYLASGRPVVVQDTGFSRWMETGAGVIPFSSLEEAIASIKEINKRYEFHCQRARETAQTYFDANQVLTCLIENCFSAH